MELLLCPKKKQKCLQSRACFKTESQDQRADFRTADLEWEAWRQLLEWPNDRNASEVIKIGFR